LVRCYNLEEVEISYIAEPYAEANFNLYEVMMDIGDERQALLICTAVNLWAAGNGVTGEAKIPEDLITSVENHVFQHSSGKTGIMQDGQSKQRRRKRVKEANNITTS
jgi:hypothetical protein